MTIRRNSELQLGNINSGKVLSVTSAETLYTIGSGTRAIEVANNGLVAVLYYGPSGLATNSAGIAINSGGGAKFWDTIVDNFQLAFRTDSAGATVTTVIHEYRGQNP